MSSSRKAKLRDAWRVALTGLVWLAALKTGMNQTSNYHYKKAQDKLHDAKQNLRTFKWSMHGWTLDQIEHQYDFLKKQVKDAQEHLNRLNKLWGRK